ncbi:hypothetical protein HNP86_001905 [Methanococcus maripaludis]|uniref:Uncharacterized protein n=1 Tax=Methanococcus maripaludis TaxID=39152 RepID=A0A7J9P140_METMI|nr:hypothetical protein [Methanococcus maripaludis]MBA2851746.1 hypothetical protein [Methanococcus maripaludis]
MIVDITQTYIKSTVNVIKSATNIDDTYSYTRQIDVDIPYDSTDPIFIPINTTLFAEGVALYKYNTTTGKYESLDNTLFVVKSNTGVILGVVASINESGKYAVMFDKQLSLTQPELYHVTSKYFGVGGVQDFGHGIQSEKASCVNINLTLDAIKSDTYSELSAATTSRIIRSGTHGEISGVDPTEKRSLFRATQGDWNESNVCTRTHRLCLKDIPYEFSMTFKLSRIDLLASEIIQEAQSSPKTNGFNVLGVSNRSVDYPVKGSTFEHKKYGIGYTAANEVSNFNVIKYDADADALHEIGVLNYNRGFFGNTYNENAARLDALCFGNMSCTVGRTSRIDSLANFRAYTNPFTSKHLNTNQNCFYMEGTPLVSMLHVNVGDALSVGEIGVMPELSIPDARVLYQDLYVSGKSSLISFKSDDSHMASLEALAINQKTIPNVLFPLKVLTSFNETSLTNLRLPIKGTDSYSDATLVHSNKQILENVIIALSKLSTNVQAIQYSMYVLSKYDITQNVNVVPALSYRSKQSMLESGISVKNDSTPTTNRCVSVKIPVIEILVGNANKN